MWIVPVAIVAVVVAMLVAAVVHWRKQWGPQLRVLKHGVAGEATVLDRNELETVSLGGGQHGRRTQYHGSLVLEVHREGQAPYRAQCKQWFEQSSWSFVGEGARVPVRIDRGDPQRVFVDTEAKLRELMSARDAERDRHAKRQDELMKR
jgi:hypothetical protein